ncbi:protein Shroom2-like isoform X2 [Ptychodera flava]|uniref:protein Shroom2-like isoform X2 n=1 Tax=Ptychodera flava TaxID=63121 RepID=UPI00396A0963
MYVRSPTAEVNKFYDHVKPDEGGHSRSMSYTYDPTSPSRAHAHGHEKPLGNINEDRHNRTSESMRLSSEVKRSSESRRKSDPRRTSDPRRDPRRKDSDPNKLSESQKSFQRSVEIEGPRHHAEDISKKKVADHDRQHRTSDPYREEYSGRRSGSDLKKDRRRSDPRREHKRSDPKTEAKPDHRYSKSDSEKYHKQTASQQWHKRSDPTSRRRQPSDPEEKKKMKEALLTFYKKKTNTGQGIAPQSMHPRLEPAESTTSLASSVRQTAYGDTNSSVEGSYQGKSNVAKRSASTSSFRHTLENPEQTMLRTKSEVMRPISMPPNAYNQSDIKRQQSFSTSGVPLRDSVSSTASYRDRPSSGGSPPGSLAGSRHLSPTQSQESILGFAQRRHQRHFVAETQPSKLQGSTYMDKTASLPASGRTGRGPPVKVSSSEAIRKMYSSQSNFKELASAAPLAKPDPSPPYRPSSSTHNRPPPLGQTDKASTLPMSFRSGEPSPGSSVQHGKLVMVEFVHSQSDSEDDRSDVEDEFDARQQQIYENPRRQSDDKIFVFPDTAPSFQTTNEPQETETQQTPKEQLTLTRQQQQSPGFPGLLKPEDQRKEKFRYRTVDSFILPTPPASPSDELVLDAEEDFPPPPPELLSNSPEIRDDSAIQRPPSREPTPSLASSTSEDNILDKVERSATMHPQTSILPGETYGSYTGKYQPRGPLAQSTATSMSSLTSLSDRTSSPINSMRPSSPRKTSPSPQPDKVVTSPSFSTAASPTVQSSVKLTLSKPPSQKSSLTSPSQFTPMKRLSPAKSLETVSQPKSPSPVKPFGMLSKFSSVQEMKRKYEFKGETLKTSPPPKSPSPTKIRSNSVGQLDSQPPQPPRKEEEEAVTVKTVAVPKTPTEKKEETASQEANTEVKAAEELPETDKTANEEEQQQSSEDKEEENKTEDEVTEEKEEEDKRTEVKPPKEKSAEELKEEELTKAICSESKDKNLSTILAPMQRTTDDYIGVLGFPTANGVQRKRRPGANRPLNSEKPSEKKVPTQKKPDPALILPATSPYYGISAVKAQLLIENKDMQEDMEPISEDSEELNQKKEELIDSIGKKLECLREEQEKLKEETSENEELGRQVTELAKSVCKENEFNKFELFVNELDSIINLLMSLSGRLARAENALSTLDPDCDPEAKLSLEDKRDRLQNQYEEAKKLKEGIDKRNEQVCVNLRKYLCDDDYADFEHFVSMKSDLIMTSRQLNDKVKLGEEQLQALKDSMKPCNKLSW